MSPSPGCLSNDRSTSVFETGRLIAPRPVLLDVTLRVYHSLGTAVAAGCLAHFYLNSRPDQGPVPQPPALRAYMGVDPLIEHITLTIAISWDTASLPREEENLRD